MCTCWVLIACAECHTWMAHSFCACLHNRTYIMSYVDTCIFKIGWLQKPPFFWDTFLPLTIQFFLTSGKWSRFGEGGEEDLSPSYTKLSSICLAIVYATTFCNSVWRNSGGYTHQVAGRQPEVCSYCFSESAFCPAITGSTPQNILHVRSMLAWKHSLYLPLDIIASA